MPKLVLLVPGSRPVDGEEVGLLKGGPSKDRAVNFSPTFISLYADTNTQHFNTNKSSTSSSIMLPLYYSILSIYIPCFCL